MFKPQYSEWHAKRKDNRIYGALTLAWVLMALFATSIALLNAIVHL